MRRRNHADVDQVSGLPYSSKELLACYDRAEPHGAVVCALLPLVVGLALALANWSRLK